MKSKSVTQLIGIIEERHLYQISIESYLYKGKRFWGVYKGDTMVGEARTEAEALKTARSFFGKKGALIRHNKVISN